MSLPRVMNCCFFFLTVHAGDHSVRTRDICEGEIYCDAGFGAVMIAVLIYCLVWETDMLVSFGSYLRAKKQAVRSPCDYDVIMNNI